MDHSSDPASPAKPTPDKGTACACSGGIIVAAALAGLGSQFACTIGWHLRSLAPQPVLAVRVVPDGQFLPATPSSPSLWCPTQRDTPAALTQADLDQESLLDPLPLRPGDS
jgi:hypothetical protein